MYSALIDPIERVSQCALVAVDVLGNMRSSWSLMQQLAKQSIDFYLLRPV